MNTISGLYNQKPKFAVAPMLDWTDRHCRYFHRLLTKHALLYTEMVVADAIIHGDRERLLGFNNEEHPIALQLGGSSPHKLAEAAAIGADFGYNEININVGCPSDRVQSGTFGACLMLEPEKVAQAIEVVKNTVQIPVTVKCRIGVDEQDIQKDLDRFTKLICDAGCDAIWVHARKAWLKGLSPKENRDIPTLDYERVYQLKDDFFFKFIGLNGGVQSINDVMHHLKIMDGVMMGRTAYHNPDILKVIDNVVFDDDNKPIIDADLIDLMTEYAHLHIERGGRLSHVTRHMVGMFHGRKGARKWRQILSSEATFKDADPRILKKAFLEIDK
ncbi:tRNA dihydrouridine(20/20a) synthase DusA [Bartonella tamiae]|uniref:tRNA-dihydrouridine(20/20a) synthase n=1 Tax=Bartonella tamiae Th239 TaxID=1094558 RepID=J0ZK71_9HYPH|nr:tRNA dihydrouridine(20/20a) synthase DusA [Bartonella tamiae]EJF88738.1 tRNA dihydrouridine synthase A [Bartonella tamiae Th239]EJF95012.1 tRNA dihydrouridine synthase A [Bartonella tamiae Th307]